MFFKNGCRILCFLWENTAWAIARVDLRPLMLYFSAVKSMVYSMDDYVQPDGRGNNRRAGQCERGVIYGRLMKVGQGERHPDTWTL